MNFMLTVTSLLTLVYFANAQEWMGLLCQVPNCRQCTGTGFCGLCQNNYILHINIEGSGTYCQPVICNISNCGSCFRDHICQFCNFGYKLTIKGRCEQAHQPQVNNCPQNCLVCEAGVCSICSFGLNLQDGVCSPIVEKQIFGCRSYISKQFCQLCIDGYLVQPDGTCKTNNYLQFSTQNMVSGIQCDILDCIFCLSPNFCGQCSGNLSVNVEGNLCIECTIPNCSLCQTNNSCSSCLPGYQINLDGQCILSIPCNIFGCSQCIINNNTIQCVSCQVFYTLTSTGNCTYCEQPCQICANGSTIYCDTCYPSLYNISGVCYSCSVLYCYSCTLESNLTICTQCLYNYMLINNTCVPPESNCSIYCSECITQEQQCFSCYSGYILNTSQNGECILCNASYCVICQQFNLSACQVCAPGFYVNINGQCIPCPYTNCQSCNQTYCFEYQNIILDFYGNQYVPYIIDPGCYLLSQNISLACTYCYVGYTLDSNRLCIPCTYPCMECDPTAPAVCFACYPNAFLSQSTCLTCDASSNCYICLPTNLSACISCPEGSLLNSITLTCSPNSCPPFCQVCLTSTVCTTCNLGYSINLQGQCLPCVNNCQQCPDNNQGECIAQQGTSCGVFGGFYIDLIGNCVKCPPLCQQCYYQGCISCIKGYYVAPNLTCIMQCSFPCASCSLSSVSMCTNCYAGYILNTTDNTCIPQTNNCSNGSCYYCPQGYIVSLNFTTCIQCTPNLNCARCNPNNLSLCLTCINGYYLQGTTCVACPQGCSDCLSNSFCVSCKTGYLLPHQPYYSPTICVACQAPCAACMSSPSTCLACIEGYTFNGWNCQTNFYFIFSITLNVTQNQFYLNYGLLLAALIGPLNNNNNIGAVTITSITTTTNSTITGTLSTTQLPYTNGVSNQYFNLINLLQESTIGSMQILSYTLEASNGQDFSNEGVDLALILGIFIPILIIIIVIIVVLVYRRYRSKNPQPESSTNYRQLKENFQSSYQLN